MLSNHKVRAFFLPIALALISFVMIISPDIYDFILYKMSGFPSEQITLYMTVITVLLLVIVMGVGYLLYVDNTVMKVSPAFSSIRKLNSKIHFLDIKDNIVISKRLSSKSAFDKCDLAKVVYSYIYNNAKAVQKAIFEIEDNAASYKQYEQDYSLNSTYVQKDEFDSLNLRYIPFTIFTKSERKLIKRLKLHKPQTSFSYICIKVYDSPQGRNHYEYSECFDSDTIALWLLSVEDKMALEKSAIHQRSLMTPSLRYNIMKRDGFRCVLCGRKASDDVILHVDHILPVTKGGQTVPSNLRTLCSVCNLGKSDKYDDNGDN